jgi:membrane protease YdiL (CAAX protease family)
LSARSLLAGEDGRIRAGWRVLIFIVVFLFCFTVGAVAEFGIDQIADSRGYNVLVTQWSFPLSLVAAHWIVLRWIERRGWDYVALGRSAARPRLLIGGLALGALAIGIPSLLLLATGQLAIKPAPDGSSTAIAAISLANLLPAAFGEEMLMRGYIFSALRDGIGWRWTLILTSIVFGLLHIPNPGSDAQSILLVILAGFFLGSILLATRSLYAAGMVHFGWNWAMAAGMHTPVSGIRVRTPDYSVVDNGPDWLTGGRWGPEGGFPSALAMFVVMIYIYWRYLRLTERKQ